MGTWRCSHSRNYLGTVCGQRPLVSSTYQLLVGLTNIHSSIWWQNKHSQKLMTLAWWPGVFMKGSNWLEMTLVFLVRGCVPAWWKANSEANSRHIPVKVAYLISLPVPFYGLCIFFHCGFSSKRTSTWSIHAERGLTELNSAKQERI